MYAVNCQKIDNHGHNSIIGDPGPLVLHTVVKRSMVVET